MGVSTPLCGGVGGGLGCQIHCGLSLGAAGVDTHVPSCKLAKESSFGQYNSKSRPRRRDLGWGGEFVPVGIEGMVTQFEGDPGWSNSPLKMKSTQPAGGWRGMTGFQVDVPIEGAARFD
jgi:hypothetical protein